MTLVAFLSDRRAMHRIRKTLETLSLRSLDTRDAVGSIVERVLTGGTTQWYALNRIPKTGNGFHSLIGLSVPESGRLGRRLDSEGSPHVDASSRPSSSLLTALPTGGVC